VCGSIAPQCWQERIWPKAGCSSENSTIRASISGAAPPALNGPVASESRSDCLGESLRAIDDEKAHHDGIEAALDEIIVQRLHGRGVFRGVFLSFY
jgi:glucose-6-phosphate dehydrogenase assembly protein OpcA